jgi:hypothetical protein
MVAQRIDRGSEVMMVMASVNDRIPPSSSYDRAAFRHQPSVKYGEENDAANQAKLYEAHFTQGRLM